jgi:hypothetical protein
MHRNVDLTGHQGFPQHRHEHPDPDLSDRR